MLVLCAVFTLAGDQWTVLRGPDHSKWRVLDLVDRPNWRHVIQQNTTRLWEHLSRGNIVLCDIQGSFQFMWPCIVTNVFIIKPTRCINLPNLFWHETPHVSGSSSAHYQEFIHCTLGTGMSYSFEDSFEQDYPGPARKQFSKLYDILPVPSVQWINSWWWSEELPETCRVSCRSKFGKLVHLVGFIIKEFVTMHGHMNV